MMSILVVEDEPKVGAYLVKGLRESGYAVELARNGADGLALALRGDHALLVLDVMLPQMDGWTVLRRLRERKQTPVIFVTARDDVADRVKGLELGADDYLVKPFAFAELLSRIKTLLRRGPLREAEHIRVADLDIEVPRRRVSRGGRRIELTAREYALLHLLASRRGEMMSRSQIASLVWDVNYDPGTNVVDVAIGRLRAKVDGPFAVKLVHTVRGMGYFLDVGSAVVIGLNG